MDSNAEDAAAALKAIAKGMADVKMSDTNAAAYLQGALDIMGLYLHASTERMKTMNDIRMVAQEWRMRWRNNLVHVTPGRYTEGGIVMDRDDLEHLLVEPGRDGWLNGEIIKAALRLRARELTRSA